MRACSVVREFIGARVGLIGPRPERFETCIFSEDAMTRQFKQRVVPTSLPDIMKRVAALRDNTPEIQKITQEMKE